MKMRTELVRHKNQNRIAVYFENDPKIIERFKRLPDARWSKTMRCWHLPDTEENRKKFRLIESKEHDLEKLKQVSEFERWLLSRRYSSNTIKTYKEALKIFIGYFKDKSIEEINNRDIIVFNNDYILAIKLSSSYQNQMVNAIKLFFGVMEDKKIELELVHRPKKEKTLPNVLSKE